MLTFFNWCCWLCVTHMYTRSHARTQTSKPSDLYGSCICMYTWCAHFSATPIPWGKTCWNMDGLFCMRMYALFIPPQKFPQTDIKIGTTTSLCNVCVLMCSEFNERGTWICTFIRCNILDRLLLYYIPVLWGRPLLYISYIIINI